MIHFLHSSFIPRKQNRSEKDYFKADLVKVQIFIVPLCDCGGTWSSSDGWSTGGVTVFTPSSYSDVSSMPLFSYLISSMSFTGDKLTTIACREVNMQLYYCYCYLNAITLHRFMVMMNRILFQSYGKTTP